MTGSVPRRDDPGWIAVSAADTLSRAVDAAIRLEPSVVFRTHGSIVVRCVVLNAGSRLPPTVIAKCAVATYGPYEPDRIVNDNAAFDFFADWAALELLRSIPNDPPLAPTLLAGDRERGITVMEDLGDGEQPNTFDALHGSNEDVAREMLIENAALVGTLHAATMPFVTQYRRLRDTLGARPAPRPLFQDPWADARREAVAPREIEQAIHDYKDILVRLGVTPNAGVDDEIARVAAAVEENPQNLLTLCKGDQNIPNDYLRHQGQPRLFDYGSAGLRHALIEGIPGRMTWGCTMRIPRELLAPMDDAYRARLAVARPEMGDDVPYQRAASEAAARWHVLHVVHRLPEAVIADRPRGPTSLRQQVVAWLLAFAELADESARMPALGASARALHARLCRNWPAEVTQLPYYPVFRR
jgi:hypothetical protein